MSDPTQESYVGNNFWVGGRDFQKFNIKPSFVAPGLAGNAHCRPALKKKAAEADWACANPIYRVFTYDSTAKDYLTAKFAEYAES